MNRPAITGFVALSALALYGCLMAGEQAAETSKKDEETKRPRRPPPEVTLVQGSKLYRVLPKDAIPSIDEPRFLEASEALYMEDSEPILGVDSGSPPKAYPLYLLDHHEIVNDTLGDRPIAATW